MSSNLSRYRIAYSKLGKVRFLGHRDVARMWERTLRRADVPVAMSTGFTPRARISFGLALPTGAESLIELLDVLVDSDRRVDGDAHLDVDVWSKRITGALPEGFALTHLRRSRESESLQESVTASSWILLIDHPGTPEAVERLRRSSSIPLERERKGERHIDDIKPGILGIDIAGEDETEKVRGIWPGDPMTSGSVTAVSAMLTTAGRGIRPTELARALFPDDEPWNLMTRVLRTNQWIDKDGQRVDVLSDSVARTEVCA